MRASARVEGLKSTLIVEQQQELFETSKQNIGLYIALIKEERDTSKQNQKKKNRKIEK